VTGLHLQAGLVREIRPQMFVTGDRSPISARLMFVSSNRTWTLHERKPLTSAFDHLLVGANGLSPRSRSLLANTGPGSDPSECSPNRRTFAIIPSRTKSVPCGSLQRPRRNQPGQLQELLHLEEDPVTPVPGSPSGMRRTLDGTRATISRTTDSASARLTLPLKWT
jgi:hypothetical protein